MHATSQFKLRKMHPLVLRRNITFYPTWSTTGYGTASASPQKHHGQVEIREDDSCSRILHWIKLCFSNFDLGNRHLCGKIFPIWYQSDGPSPLTISLCSKQYSPRSYQH